MALSIRSASKAFGAVQANRDISIDFQEGEIHALLGENGAGKSTLINLMAGIYRPDAGEILIRNTDETDSNKTRGQGVSVVYQHSPLVAALTVIENIALQEAATGPISWRDLRKRACAAAEEIGFDIPLDRMVKDLTVGTRQRAEIVRALLFGAKVLVLDEPTSILSPGERVALFATLRALRSRGQTVIFVTHRLEEALQEADRITILRHGRVVSRIDDPSTCRPNDLVKAMVGESVPVVDRAPASPGELVLDVNHLSGTDPRTGTGLRAVSFEVRRGEVLGVAGIEGAGQSELAAAIAGTWEPSQGSIRILGRPLGDFTSKDRVEAVSDIPDSFEYGIASERPVWSNLSISEMLWTSRPSLRARRTMRERAPKMMVEFDVRAPSPDTVASGLSGGNQQRVVLARELSKGSSIVVAAYPTKGLDVRSAALVRQRLVVAAREDNKAVLFFSSDLDEIFEVSDRVMVLNSGTVISVKPVDDTNLETVGRQLTSAAVESAAASGEDLESIGVLN